MKKPNIAVVFDLDGTLVNTAEDIAFSVNHMRRTLGLSPLDTLSVLRAVGRGAGYLMQHTLELDSHDTARREELLSAYRDHYRAHQGERSKPYEGIAEALRQTADIAKLYVLSNKPEDATIRELDIAGLSGHFQKIWGAGSFETMKPHPTGVNAAMSHAETDSAHTVMVGDLFVDMETAANAGVHSIFVTWGFGSREDLHHTPSRIATAALQLPDLVTSIAFDKN
jgi:phosphoglycolate phosphatase